MTNAASIKNNNRNQVVGSVSTPRGTMLIWEAPQYRFGHQLKSRFYAELPNGQMACVTNKAKAHWAALGFNVRCFSVAS